MTTFFILRDESTGKFKPIMTSKLLPRRYKSVIYKESKIMVVIFEIAQFAILYIHSKNDNSSYLVDS